MNKSKVEVNTHDRGHSLRKTKILVNASIFVALSIILGKYIPAFNIAVLRVSFENLPIIMSGILFGPIVGGMTGAVADIVGCYLVGYEINVLVTAGSITLGIVSGFIFNVVLKNIREKLFPKILVSGLMAHLLGSVVIKSVGLVAYYSWPFYQLFLIRLLTYAIICTAESFLIYVLLKNRNLRKLINELRIKDPL